MMQIWFLSNGSYSLKNCHNPFGKAIQPPPPYGKIPVEHLKSLHGSSLTLSDHTKLDLLLQTSATVVTYDAMVLVVADFVTIFT